MNNQELDRILKSAPVPERSHEYWEQFPGRVRLAIRRGEMDPQGPSSLRAITQPKCFRYLGGTPKLAFGLAFACLTLSFAFSLWHIQNSLLTGEQVAVAGKYFRETQALFPHQLEVIEFDRAGARLVLSDRANVPLSQPLYLKLCSGNQCRNFVTFSGQEIHLNGENLQVLVDRQGAVMVVGQQWVWSSLAPGDKAGPYRIAARLLPTI